MFFIQSKKLTFSDSLARCLEVFDWILFVQSFTAVIIMINFYDNLNKLSYWNCLSKLYLTLVEKKRKKKTKMVEK